MKRYVAGVVVLVLAVLASAISASTVHALVPDGDAGWYWQMPQPVGGELVDVAFPSEAGVWAAGGKRILHSEDGGVTWEVQYSSSDADLTSIAFADEKRGIACGERTGPGDPAPLVLITSDGGATWTDSTPAASTGSFGTVSMTADGHAWIGGTQGQLWTTADCGATWTKRRVGSYAGRVAVTLVDEKTGWAAGSAGRVWRTLDGGASWTRQATGLESAYQVAQMESGDAGHAWALAYRSSRDRLTSRVLATSDGGLTWRRAFSSSAQLVTDVHAVGSSSAWLVSADLSGLLGQALGLRALGSTSRLHHTLDGGVSWTTATLSSPTVPYAIAGDDDSLCAAGSGIFTSSDGGTTWLSQTSGAAYLFAAAQAVSTTDVWAVDYVGAVVHSSDGVHWEELAAPQRWAQTLTDVSFSDPDHGWLVGSSAATEQALILHTADGGKTWTEQTSPLTSELAAVDFVDAANGWAVTDSGLPAGQALQHTSDGGATWRLQRPRKGINGLMDVDFIDPLKGWVTGQYDTAAMKSGLVPGAVFRTTDGGASWRTYPLPKNTLLSQLQFMDERSGWAIAEKITNRSFSAFVVRTDDAGESWTKVAVSGGHPTRVHFLDAQTGWVAFAGEGVYGTTDGGLTWRHLADSYASLAIAASDASHVWAFGLGDLVATVDSAADTAPPSTVSSGDSAWHRTTQTLTLTPNDVGGAGLAGTEYSLDMGGTWQDGTTIDFEAPADHTNDGAHRVLYRSTDLVGNREATQLGFVNIDTLGPRCSAPKKAVVNAGSKGILRFMATDATSGVRRATITLSDSRGRVRRTFVKYAGNWGASPEPTYYWFRFDCNLRPGRYRITVRAVDHAGNEQVKVGRNWLRVVRSGAPKARRPWWPSGLPNSALTGAPSAAAFAAGASAGQMTVMSARARSLAALPAFRRMPSLGHGF